MRRNVAAQRDQDAHGAARRRVPPKAGVGTLRAPPAGRHAPCDRRHAATEVQDRAVPEPEAVLPPRTASLVDQHLAVSQRIAYEDLDFAQAKAVGLTAREIDNLGFFADIESQTVFYFLEVAPLKVARDPELLAFLTMWNYEELFHARAISALLAACGVDVLPSTERTTAVRAAAQRKAYVEDVFQRSLARVMPRTFVALWMFWGALQEALTAQAYEQVLRTTPNPVLAELFRRITKQERRHFAFYYAQARARLDGDVVAQRIVKTIAERFFAPVGSGVKSPAELATRMGRIFPDGRLAEIAVVVDQRMAQLPGMTGFAAVQRWVASLPATHADAA